MDGFVNFTYHEKMTGFLIKKTFFDLWDNLFQIVLINLGFIVSLTVPVFLSGFIPVPALANVIFAAGIIWCFIYLTAIALSVKAVSDYGTFGFADFRNNFKAGLPTGVLTGLICLLLFSMVKIIIPFYLQINSPIGILLAAAVFWTFALSLVSFQFFFAIRARLDTKPAKIIKKCFIIFFDNPCFSIISLLCVIIMLVLSVIPPFLFPGPAGIVLFLDGALRLRLLKYDWLEANGNPPASRKTQIPWDTILAEEREKTGTRTLKNFIFPWKD